MSDPTPPPDAPPPTDQEPVRAPFRPGGAPPFQPIGPAAGGSGCAKPALIGCGVLFLLLGVAAVVFLFKWPDFAVWSLANSRQAIEQNLAPEVTAADRTRFDAAFQAAAARLRAQKLDPAALQALQTLEERLLRVVRKKPGDKVGRDEYLDLIDAFEQLGGTAPPGDKAAPSPPVAAREPSTSSKSLTPV